MEVTDDEIHDGKVMEKLVEQVLENNRDVTINSLLGDGGAYYDSNENFKYLQKKKIQPGIKVRKNSITLRKNNKLRNREVYSQTKDLLKWKKSRKYGKQMDC